MLEITVFVCGALVMIFEIIGSRILAPFIGTSTYVWTSLIGIILASLSAGYWIGGRLADRRPEVKLLAEAVLTAGALVSLTILIKDVLLSFIAAMAVGLELKAVIAALLLFAPASVCLGFVTPFAVRLKTTTVETAAGTVGRLYAISTIGSIAGTFAGGFFLIPFVGSVRTLYLIAGGLILVSISLVPLAASRTGIAAIVLFLFGVTANETSLYILSGQRGFRDIDTEYSRVQIFETVQASSGKPIRAMATDPYFVQSAMFLEGDDLALGYSPFYHLLRHFAPGFKQTLIIGGAGYSFPREYLRTYDKAAIDVVEIDPQMTAIARESFRLVDDPRMSIIDEDGRMFINRTQSARYDVVLMDAFGSLFTVPYHLTTLEAVQNLHRILNDDGVVIFNLGSSVTGVSSNFLHAELATYGQVFRHVYVFKVNSEYPDDKLQNVIIVASKADPGVGLSSDDPFISALLEHRYTQGIAEDRPVLTDDLAPVEYYNSIAQNAFLRERKKP